MLKKINLFHLILVTILVSLSGCGYSGHFEELPSMIVPRYNHWTFLLPDGRALIIGGLQHGPSMSLEDRPTEKVEVFNPVTQKFSLLPSLHIEAQGNKWEIDQVVQLQDYTYLILGRFSEKQKHWEKIYIYDPQAGTTKQIGNMVHPRLSAQAIVLKNGDVLFLGGVKAEDPGSDIIPEAEKFIFSKKVFVADQRLANVYNTTLLNDGRVLILTFKSFWNRNKDMVWQYDPGTDKFQYLTDTPMGIKQCTSATVLRNEKVLLLCGDADTTEHSAAIFSPKTNKITEISPLNEIRSSPSVTMLANGDVLITRGFTRIGFTPHEQKSMEIFDWQKEIFLNLIGVSWDRYNTTLLLKDEKVLFTGDRPSQPTPNAWLFERT